MRLLPSWSLRPRPLADPPSSPRALPENSPRTLVIRRSQAPTRRPRPSCRRSRREFVTRPGACETPVPLANAAPPRPAHAAGGESLNVNLRRAAGRVEPGKVGPAVVTTYRCRSAAPCCLLRPHRARCRVRPNRRCHHSRWDHIWPHGYCWSIPLNSVHAMIGWPSEPMTIDGPTRRTGRVADAAFARSADGAEARGAWQFLPADAGPCSRNVDFVIAVAPSPTRHR